MDYAQQQRQPGKHLTGITVVIILHAIVVYALVTGLALVPLVIAGNKPGHEIEHPMALVILGGLLTSTMLNLFVLPALSLRFWKRPTVPDEPSRAQ